MVSTPFEPTESESMQAEQAPLSDDGQYKLINRVISYPTVSNLWESAKGAYSSAKESSYLVKRSCEMVETNLDSTMKYIVQPVLENERVKKLSEPLLSTVDEFGCKQLDKLEKYQPTVSAMKDDIVAKTTAIVQTSVQKIEPIDQFLKTNYLATPINIAVDVTENFADRVLPKEENASQATSDNATSPGPIIRGSKIARRMQKEAFAKLKNLNLRNVDTISSYQHVVDLIQYAASNLDAGVEATSKFAERTKETVKSVTESPVVQQTALQVRQKTMEAVQALAKAVDILSDSVSPIGTASSAVVERSKKFAATIEEANTTFYSILAQASAQKLRETGAMLAASVSSGGIPAAHLIEGAKSTILGVLDSFVGTRDYTEASKAVPATLNAQ